MAPPYYVTIYLCTCSYPQALAHSEVVVCLLILSLLKDARSNCVRNGRQVIREQDVKTGWDKMGQSGAGDSNFRPLGDSSDTMEREFGKKWENMGRVGKNSAPFFPRGHRIPPAVLPLPDVRT